MDSEVQDFWKNNEFAVVGVSTSRTKFGGSIYLTMKAKGFRVYPVNPRLKEFAGDRCYRKVSELPRSVSAAIICVKPDAAVEATNDAIQHGMRHIWYQQGADFSEPAALATAAGVSTVTGKCALMYVEPVTGIHRFHRFFTKLFDRY